MGGSQGAIRGKCICNGTAFGDTKLLAANPAIVSPLERSILYEPYINFEKRFRKA